MLYRFQPILLRLLSQPLSVLRRALSVSFLLLLFVELISVAVGSVIIILFLLETADLHLRRSLDFRLVRVADVSCRSFIVSKGQPDVLLLLFVP